MIDYKLLNKKLEFYNKQNKALKTISFNQKIVPQLFNEFKHFSMVEHYYCCRGLEECCWQELIEEGNFDLTVDEVKEHIIDALKMIKKYLYNREKYGSRFYFYKDNDCCHIYIYMRDIFEFDYSLCFSNSEI